MSAVIAQAVSSQIEIVPFQAPLGAEVHGLDLTRPVDDGTFSRIHRAHLDHHVLVFRDQELVSNLVYGRSEA